VHCPGQLFNSRASLPSGHATLPQASPLVKANHTQLTVIITPQCRIIALTTITQARYQYGTGHESYCWAIYVALTAKCSTCVGYDFMMTLYYRSSAPTVVYIVGRWTRVEMPYTESKDDRDMGHSIPCWEGWMALISNANSHIRSSYFAEQIRILDSKM